MRIVLIILTLLNLLAFASAMGWLGHSAARGEPERLSNQLNPERIQLRPAGAVPADAPVDAPAPSASTELPAAAAPDTPPTAKLACVIFGGLTEAQIAPLRQAIRIASPEVRTEHLSTTTPSAWWVRIPPNGGREGAERKVAELRALGVDDLFIVQDPGPNQFAVSLGLFKSEAKAQQHLAFLQNKRVRSASITTRSAVIHRIEVRGTPEELQALERTNAIRQSGATTGPCPT